MKTSARSSVLSAAIGLGLLAASGASWAESQYGYDPSGTGQRTAQARLNISVSVAKLLLLRVGSSGTTVDTIALGNFNGIPGGVTTLQDGNNQASGWDGTAPTLIASSTASVQAWAWTNSAGGGNVTAAVTTPFVAGSGITAGDITVTSTPVAGAAAPLPHPGASTGNFTVTGFPRNAVATSTWAFATTPAILNNVVGGTANTQTVTYTATTL